MLQFAFQTFSTAAKKAKPLTGSRKEWMQRHVNDPFVKASKLVSSHILFDFTAEILQIPCCI
jgi:hypothetical protein